MLELDDLFVDPTAMRRGVARHLLLRIATEAEREGVARIDVTANMHAFAFYDAVGFVAGSRVDTNSEPAVACTSTSPASFARRLPPSRPEDASVRNCVTEVQVAQNMSGHHGVTGQPNAVEARVTAPGLTSVTRPAACRVASDTPPR